MKFECFLIICQLNCMLLKFEVGRDLIPRTVYNYFYLRGFQKREKLAKF